MRRLCRIVVIMFVMLLSINAEAQYSGPYSVLINGSRPFDLGQFKPGDRVRITIQNRTSDTTTPETIEGEGCIKVFFTSDLPDVRSISIPCDINLNYNALFSVPTQSLTPYTGYAQFDTYDGDEEATVTITVNPVEVVSSTPQEVFDYMELAAALERGEVAAQAAEQLCNLLPHAGLEICKVAENTLGIIYGTLANYYKKLAAQDPIDHEFTNFDVPHVTLPRLSGHDALSKSVNGLIDNHEQQVDLIRAVLISINRASGAMVAGNIEWKDKQVRVAARYLKKLSHLTSKQVALQNRLKDIWTQLGYPTLVSSALELHNAQLQLRAFGFQPNQIELFRRAGLTGQDISDLATELITLDYRKVADIGGFPASLTYQPFVDALDNAAESLRNMAQSTKLEKSNDDDEEKERLVEKMR
jgi:hypothetical protein